MHSTAYATNGRRHKTRLPTCPRRDVLAERVTYTALTNPTRTPDKLQRCTHAHTYMCMRVRGPHTSGMERSHAHPYLRVCISHITRAARMAQPLEPILVPSYGSILPASLPYIVSTPEAVPLGDLMRIRYGQVRNYTHTRSYTRVPRALGFSRTLNTMAHRTPLKLRCSSRPTAPSQTDSFPGRITWPVNKKR